MQWKGKKKGSNKKRIKIEKLQNKKDAMPKCLLFDFKHSCQIYLYFHKVNVEIKTYP